MHDLVGESAARLMLGLPSRKACETEEGRIFPKRDAPPTIFSTTASRAGIAVESLDDTPSGAINLLVTKDVNLTKIKFLLIPRIYSPASSDIFRMNRDQFEDALSTYSMKVRMNT